MIIGLIAVMASLFGAGGALSFDATFRPFVKDVVVDEQRYDQISETFDEADEYLEAFRKDFQDQWEPKVKKLVGDYDTTKDDFRTLREGLSQPRTTAMRKVLDVRFTMVEIMTEDEWNAMFKAVDAKAKEKDD